MIEIWRNLLRVFYGNQVNEYTKKELLVSLVAIIVLSLTALVIYINIY